METANPVTVARRFASSKKGGYANRPTTAHLHAPGHAGTAFSKTTRHAMTGTPPAATGVPRNVSSSQATSVLTQTVRVLPVHAGTESWLVTKNATTETPPVATDALAGACERKGIFANFPVIPVSVPSAEMASSTEMKRATKAPNTRPSAASHAKFSRNGNV